MNPVVIIHLVVAAITIASAVPLIQRRVKMNPWYGVKIPEAYVSEERWYEINEYGGRLLLLWGFAIGVMAVIGAFLKKTQWANYDMAALVVILGSLTVVFVLILRHARRGSANRAR